MLSLINILKKMNQSVIIAQERMTFHLYTVNSEVGRKAGKYEDYSLWNKLPAGIGMEIFLKAFVYI